MGYFQIALALVCNSGFSNLIYRIYSANSNGSVCFSDNGLAGIDRNKSQWCYSVDLCPNWDLFPFNQRGAKLGLVFAPMEGDGCWVSRGGTP